MINRLHHQTMPATGDLIDDAYYDDIFARCSMIANYYNITNPFAAVNAGDIVNWSDYAGQISAFITAVEDRFDDPHFLLGEVRLITILSHLVHQQYQIGTAVSISTLT